MQGREPTHLESLLQHLVAPVRRTLGEHPTADPMAALVAWILHDEEPQRCPQPGSNLGNESLLKAGRAYFTLLAENDRLPPEQQLTPQELALPRNLLLAFFVGQDSLQQRAQDVLSLIEHKFAERAFPQATLLLQLFETDQTTRVQNERKLFYEDMIQRLGVRRRDPLSQREGTLIRDHFAAIAADLATPKPYDPDKTQPESSPQDITPLTRSFTWLADQYHLRFCLLLSSDAERADWHEISRMGDARHAAAFERAVPPLRWRAVQDHGPAPLLSLVSRHITPQTLKDHLQTLTKACYFILLAVGDTGLEGFIDTYFRWLQDRLKVDGTAFIDRLHRESTLGERALQETLDAIHDEFFAQPLAQLRQDFTPLQLHQASLRLSQQLSQADLSEIAPGHFNLGGFFLDHLLDIPHPSPEFSFRLHRLT